MHSRRRAWPVLGGCALALGLYACGGDGDSITQQPTPTPAPTPPPPRVVAQQNGFSVQVNYVVGEYFDISGTGTIDTTVDYTYADTALVVWIAKGQCTGEMWANDQCQYVATSFAGSKPRKVTAANQAAGTYTHIVGNFGPRDESISYQVVFTQTSTAGAPPSASSVRPDGGRIYLVPVPEGRLRP